MSPSSEVSHTLPRAWNGLDISGFLERLQGTEMGLLLSRWHFAREEIKRMTEKRDHALDVLHDSVLAMRISHKITELGSESDRLLEESCRVQSRNLDEVLCKLTMWRQSQCPMDGSEPAEVKLAASAFDELLRFAVARPEAAAKNRRV